MASSFDSGLELERPDISHSEDGGIVTQSLPDSISTCSRPPSSLLIERSQSPSSLLEHDADAQLEPGAPNSSPASPPHLSSEPAALQPSFRAVRSSCSSLATTVDKETTNVCLGYQQEIPLGLKEIRPGKSSKQATHVSKHHFEGPAPIGDPVLSKLQHFRLEYPPPSRDRYHELENNFFQHSSMFRSIDVEKLLEDYADEGAQFVEFLATQEQIREEKYTAVAEARQHAKSALEGFLREQRQKAEAARAAERKMKGRLSLMRPSSPPHLTPAQLQVMRTLEADLIGRMEDVSINHGESEGAIAGFFTFKLDKASERPPEEMFELLTSTSSGLHPRLLQTPLVASHDLGEQSYLDGMNKPTHKSFYQENLDGIRSKNRAAYNQAFWAHQQQEHAPSPRVELKLGPCSTAITESPSLHPTMDHIPDWFYVFQTYNIIDFWSTSSSCRFTQLLNTLRHLEIQCETSKSQQPRWEKEWHEASSLWSNPVWRKSGG